MSARHAEICLCRSTQIFISSSSTSISIGLSPQGWATTSHHRQASSARTEILYTDVYRIEELNELHDMLQAECGYNFDLPWRQRSSISTSVDEISVRELGIIQSSDSGDYALLRKLYSPRAVLERRSSRQAWSRIVCSSVSLQELLPLLDLTVIGSHSVSKDTVVYTEGCHGGCTHPSSGFPDNHDYGKRCVVGELRESPHRTLCPWRKLPVGD